MRRVPRRHGRALGGRAAGGDLHARRELPGGGIGGHRGPDVVGGGGQVDLAADLEFAAHDGDSSVVGLVILGCRATTKRCSRPRARMLVVVLGHETVDGVCQLDRERGPVLGRREAHLAVDAEGRQRLAGGARPGDELADLGHQAPGDAEQPARRALIGRPRRVRSHRRQRGGRDDVGRGGGLHDALGAVALAALLDQLDQPVVLQRAQVVVDLLARQAGLRGEGRRGARIRQRREQPGADRVQRGLGRGGVVDDRDVVHERHLRTDNSFCQDYLCCRVMPNVGPAPCGGEDRRSATTSAPWPPPEAPRPRAPCCPRASGRREPSTVHAVTEWCT